MIPTKVTTRYKWYLPLRKNLCWTATVLKGLFGEYHSSLAALGLQGQEIAKHILVSDWLVTPKPPWC